MKNKINQLVSKMLRPVNNKKAEGESSDIVIASKGFSWGKFALVVVISIGLIVIAIGLISVFNGTIGDKFDYLKNLIANPPV